MHTYWKHYMSDVSISKELLYFDMPEVFPSDNEKKKKKKGRSA